MVKKFVPVSIVLVVTDVSKDGFSLWMQKRKEEGILNDFWEFPGGKIESDETPKDAPPDIVISAFAENATSEPANADKPIFFILFILITPL